jgi:heme-degrading monooxygenase HmoA
MFSVIFEVHPRPDRSDEYFATASHLKPLLQKIDGFVDNERFRSLRRPGWFLSHSTWRDEKSVVRWRSTGEHHLAQTRGRTEVFSDYHLRVGQVVFDDHRSQNARPQQQRFDTTEIGHATLVSLIEMQLDPKAAYINQPDLIAAHVGLSKPPAGMVEYDVFTSITTEGKIACLISWATEPAAAGRKSESSLPIIESRERRVRVLRDYGMFDRREAPQFFPPHEKTVSP